jgi:hypothetical protein
MLTCTLETTLRTLLQVFHTFSREWAWIEKALTLSSLSAFKSDQAAIKRICDFTDADLPDSSSALSSSASWSRTLCSDIAEYRRVSKNRE